MTKVAAGSSGCDSFATMAVHGCPLTIDQEPGAIANNAIQEEAAEVRASCNAELSRNQPGIQYSMPFVPVSRIGAPAASVHAFRV